MQKNKIKTPTFLGPGDNYFIFEELNVDSIGKNYRAVELHQDSPIAHKCLTEVHPFLFTDPEIWDQASLLFQQLGKIGIPNLYTPETIIKKGERTFLVFPFINGKTLAQVVEQAAEKKKPVPFDLAFSIALAVVNLIERGATLVIEDRNSFHGFLSPDHIFMGYNGTIFLKYFGLWLLLDENETAVSEMTRKYGAWLSPEFIRGEKILRQSDIYYLGYIVFRMLTGHYFSYLPGEDFESTFTSIRFVSDLPTTDIPFLTTFINFFKRTLNPAVNKRFSNTNEFKDYILENFPPLSDDAAFQSRLAHYLETLYADERGDEEKMLAEELSPSLAETEAGLEDLMESKIIETISLDIGQEKKQRPKSLLAALFLIIILGLLGGTYIVVHQLNQAKKERQTAAKLLVEQDKEKREIARKLLEVQQKLKTLEEQKTTGQQEQQIKDQEISQLKQQEKSLIEKEESREKTMPASGPPRKTSPVPEPTHRLPTEKPAVKSPEPTPVPVPQPPLPKNEMRTPAPLVPWEEATIKPVKLSGSEPQFPPEMAKTYVGRRATVTAQLLIDETGDVVQVKIENESTIPRDVREVIVDTLSRWKYKPAQKGETRVKVWWPYKLKIHFKYDM